MNYILTSSELCKVASPFCNLADLHRAMLDPAKSTRTDFYLDLVNTANQIYTLKASVFHVINWYLHRHIGMESMLTLEGIPEAVSRKHAANMGKALLCTCAEDYQKMHEQFTNDKQIDPSIDIQRTIYHNVFWQQGNSLILQRTADFQIFSKFCLEGGGFQILTIKPDDTSLSYIPRDQIYRVSMKELPELAEGFFRDTRHFYGHRRLVQP